MNGILKQIYLKGFTVTFDQFNASLLKLFLIKNSILLKSVFCVIDVIECLCCIYFMVFKPTEFLNTSIS